MPFQIGTKGTSIPHLETATTQVQSSSIMRLLTAILLVSALPVFGSDAPNVPAPSFCATAQSGTAGCSASKQDRKSAKAVFDKGVKLRNSHHLEEALNQFKEASRL